MRIVALTNETKQDILKNLLKRSPGQYPEYEATVQEIIDHVKKEGDQALITYSKKFDGCELTADSMRVTEQEIEEAYAAYDPELIAVMKRAHDNIEEYHKKQIRYSWIDTRADGTILGQKITPLEKVGVYVPGGKAAYPSSTMMCVIPAKVAGVDRIIMMTPPGKTGIVNPGILVAAKICGVTEIYKVGGAQAIAALAYGTETIPNVYKIVGPGNIFVALAKKAVYGNVSIDSIAGPSEILVLAEETANAR